MKTEVQPVRARPYSRYSEWAKEKDMTYLVTFLEGVLSFISPCMLPLLPVYLSYFAGEADQKGAKLPRTLAFVLGFSVSFIGFGLAASAMGAFLSKYRVALNIACGMLMIFFGLVAAEIVHLRIPVLQSGRVQVAGVFSAFLFGLIYPVNLMPCVGAFLGSALALAASSGSMAQGALLLAVYSLGLGVPFVLSALLMSHLTDLFTKIKSHYGVIKKVSGAVLIIVGLLTAFGVFEKFMAIFA